MEGLFCRFETYNFESDAKFQEGLRSFPNAHSNSSEESGLLDMKLFYYNRQAITSPWRPAGGRPCTRNVFVEPIDRSTYKQWRSSKGTPDSSCNVQPTEGSTETEAAILTFAEVMKLVQEGKEVPGVKRLDIQPTNQNPAPSQMTRRLKPWELT